jgi:CheY-like chemotaxis protein
MPRLLIVDDDLDGREALCKFLVGEGHEVECVSNGRDALSSILATTPDLVILDVYMPEMMGTALLEILRSYLRLQSLPVIVLTGLADSPLIDQVRTLKVNAIFVKGKATFEDIRAAVNQEVHRLPN